MYDFQDSGWALSPPDVRAYVKQASPEVKDEYMRTRGDGTPENELHHAQPGSSSRVHPDRQVPSGTQTLRRKRETSPLERRIRMDPDIKQEPTEEDLRNIPMHPGSGNAARSIGHPLLGRFSHRQCAIYGLAQWCELGV